ncbi:poly-gamma-glutamate synthase PgsB [Streptomyces goshikiensis]|uniref:poly-gamma-glutamate synthase PgsB n=1 Tax=Streptomyces goshikiensis TaxID=1942 RepID=UPI003648C337
MLFLYCVLLVCCLIMLIAGVLEQRRHFANLDHIPHRVLVNGIRGKSSITRLCAGALRGGGLTTVAKTTGTAARFIHPDATEEPVYRKFGIANVVEQIGIVRRAAAYRPHALVMECMAVMPALQEINQSKLIQSTIGVLCNVREDHVAEMGPTLDDIARSLSRSMPHDGICVTAEKERFDVLQEEADARNCRLVYADPDTVSDEELRGFSWFTFKENVAIALTVAELLGVDRETALQGMYDAPPDPGVLSVERYLAPGGKRLRFANVFAANDPESTLMNINQLLDLGAVDRPLNVVINCRPDRVERNAQMGSIIPELRPDRVFVIGHPARSAIDAIPAEWRDRAVDLGGDHRDGEEFVHELLGHLGASSSLVAIGNIHGQGEVLLEHLAELPADETDDPAAVAPAAPDPAFARPADPYADAAYADAAYGNAAYGGGGYEVAPYEGGGHEGRAYEGSGHEGRAYEGGGHDGRAYDDGGHDGRRHAGGEYDGRYEGAAYEGRGHAGGGHEVAPYEGGGHEGGAYEGRYDDGRYEGVAYEDVPYPDAGDAYAAGPYADPYAQVPYPQGAVGIEAATPVPAWPQPQPQVHPFPRQGHPHPQNPGEPR